jgi:hypothetical protein
MNQAVREVLKAAIEAKRREIEQLEEALRDMENEDNPVSGKLKRRRRRSGFKQGSVPFLVHEILTTMGTPLTPAELAEALASYDKKVTTNILAGSLNRYMGKVFDRTEDGKYTLRN